MEKVTYETVGDLARSLKVDEEALNKAIDSYERYEEGTIGHEIWKRLAEFRDADRVGRAMQIDSLIVEQYAVGTVKDIIDCVREDIDWCVREDIDSKTVTTETHEEVKI